LRRGRQVGAIPAARLVAGRDGRPDAGSALIHAATMVAAGVYMLVRVGFLINASSGALHVIAWIGTITAVLAALMATQQNDIKRILAYSTSHSLGYMVMAIGLASGQAGDVPPLHPRRLQGASLPGLVRSFRCITSRTSGGWAARKTFADYLPHFSRRHPRAHRFPGFSGFFSKDAILVLAYETSRPIFRPRLL
jgi:hypothetical protein